MLTPSPIAYKCRSGSAFTLIELLVVIGLIAVLAGGIGLALGRGDNGIALQTAQSTLNSAISGARAKAALEQKPSAIFINAQPKTDNFLREIRIAVDTDPSSGENWEIRGDPILLPKGIYLVPPDTVFSSPDEVEFQGTWQSGSWTLHSTAYANADVTLKDAAANDVKDSEGNSVVYNRICEFSVTGTTTAGKMVFSPAERQSDLSLRFDKPDFVRGSIISRYGVATMVNEMEAFK